jgi:hypothetical protein
MIRSVLLGVSGTLALIVVAACGEDDPVDKYPTIDSFCVAKAAQECDAVAAACSVSDDTCKGARKNACLTAASTATGQGRTYRSANAQNCIDKTTVLYGDRVLDPTKEQAFETACERVFIGSKKKSEACTNAYDCEGDLVCDLDKGFCAEKVTRKLKDGCNNPGDICDKGLFCNAEGGAKFCETKNALGTACLPPAGPCLENLWCNAGTCAALKAAGDTCAANEECVTNFCNPDKKCQAAQYASETGTCKDFGGT